MISFASLAWLGAAAHIASAVSFTVPTSATTGALPYAPVEVAPLGLSFEFFAFPAYFHNVTATNLCLANLKALSGTWPPIRIGGTTQDRASYDANLLSEVVYSVETPVDAPKALKFGPSFFELAAMYAGNVTLSLNRGKNDINNTIAAAKAAVQSIGNLYAIELGNEPEYWAKTQPIASDAWDPAIDAASQNEWAIIVGNAIDKKDIVQAGNSNSLPPRWGAQELIASGNITAREFVRTYSHHNYPGGNVSSLMSHSNAVNNVHFPYSFFGEESMGNPYVGVYAATSFLAGARYVAALDDGKSAFAAYATFDASGAPLRMLLYNSNYHSGIGSRSVEDFIVDGISASQVRSKRVTADGAEARQDRGGNASIGQQYFHNATCSIGGTETFEVNPVWDGQATFSVAASEALLVYLQ
ncbi:Beta-glucuronidase [Colletotrichum sidae]|uniref:Beta-glucuronidase n=1 Tax=Colletotrichum sidae TaxID=1347389 RepID=A0A4V3I1M4_9PEZI|nr:Beta-glucuronidase [Colletotrichum sidae]